MTYKLKRKEAGPLKDITTIGIDLAKNVFQLHGINSKGIIVLRKRLGRRNVLPFFANLRSCLIGLEACCGSHFWARELEKLGHEVRQMPPQYVKAYVKTNKNDANDAEAVCEAVSRPNMRFVPTKSEEQLNLQALHRIRERLVRSRTSLSNQIRGLLLEAGISIPQGVAKIRNLLPEIYEDLSNRLTLIERDYLSDLYTELVDLDGKVLKYEKQLQNLCGQSAECQKLLTIPGIGLLTATALISAIGDAHAFKNGRQLAAWVGLTPRQHSSGGKDRLMGISKRGNCYLRKLLVHGARSVVYRCRNKDDSRSKWLAGIEDRRGTMKATVAQANKTARIVWAVLVKNEPYCPAA
jgi:transposase